MAYRKTEKILAQIEARKNIVLAATLDILGADGPDAVTVDAVAARAEMSVGAIYKYFPDKVELVAAAIGRVMARDLAAMQATVESEVDPGAGLVAALAVLYDHNRRLRLVPVLLASPLYRAGIIKDLARLIGRVREISPKAASGAAAAAMGAIFAACLASDGRKSQAAPALLFALCGIGLSERAAMRALERYSLADV